MEIYLPYLYQNVLIELHSNPGVLCVQCLMESGTRITQA